MLSDIRNHFQRFKKDYEAYCARHSLLSDTEAILAIERQLYEKEILTDTNIPLFNANQLKLVLDNSGLVVYDYTIHTGTIRFQGSISALTGYSAAFISQQTADSFLKLIHPDDRQAFILLHSEARNNQKPYRLEYRILKNDGVYIYVEDNGSYCADPLEGQQIIGVITDISSRKQAEALWHAKERGNKLLQDISTTVNDAGSIEDVLIHAMKTICTYTNWTVAHGLVFYNKSKSAAGISVSYTAKPERYQRLLNTFAEPYTPDCCQLKVVLEKNAAWVPDLDKETEHQHRTQALQSGLRSLFLAPVYNAGHVIALMEFYSEFTEISDKYMPELMEQIGFQLGSIIERKMAEEALIKLSKAIDQNPVTVIITDENGYIEYVNPKFTETTGYSVSEVLGKKVSVNKSNLHPAEFYQHLWATITSGAVWHAEICNKRKDGSLIWEDVSISPIKNAKGSITNYVAVRNDITDKKNHEEDLKKAKEAAIAADKAKTDFLANMSHEIRTPMNAILGFAELLSAKVVDEQQQSFLDSIKVSGKNLLALINDVLDLSKIEAGKMQLNNEFIDPFMLFKDLEYLFALKAREKGLDFNIETDLSLPLSIDIDEVRLRQVLVNLIGNAIKFTESGFVKVKVTCSPPNVDNAIDMFIAVEDSGIGIQNDFKDKMFQPFTQQDGQSTKKYGGTGLGLSITTKLLQLLNGSINVHSKVGIGSVFNITLRNIRATSEKQLQLDLLTIDPSKIKFEPVTLLIADDVENNRKYLKSVLQETALVLLETDNGNEALEMVRHFRPKLVITDLKMPGLSGFDILKAVKNDTQLNDILVVATTASSSIEERSKMLVHNFDGILLKPIQVNDVFLELLRLLPHTIVPDPVVGTGNDVDIAIEALADADIQTVKQLLDGEFLTIWQTFSEQQPLSDVEEFAQKLRELGKIYKLEILTSYGNRLLSAINNFDIDVMLKALNDFPKLLRTFKIVND